LALVGVRYLIARDSRVYPAPPLERVSGWGGYSVYALGDVNLAGYGASSLAFGDTLADQLRLMRRRGFDPRRTAVLPTAARRDVPALSAEGLAPLVRSTLRIEPDTIDFSARSSGRPSLAVLPLLWSSCWRPEWRQGAGSLLRVDAGLIGVAFAGETEVRLRWTAGYGDGRACLEADRGMAAEAQAAAAEVGYGEAYEPFDENSPPYAVTAPRFARANDLVAEHELIGRGDIEAVLPASAAAFASGGGAGRAYWSIPSGIDFRARADGYELGARNDGGRSLVVLPMRYSECWQGTWEEGSGMLVPVDEKWLGVLFRASAQIRLRRADEGERSDCARRDLVRQTVLARLDELPGRTGGGAYAFGETIRFSAGGNAENYTTTGWSGPESWGRWSVGKTAQLVLRVEAPATGTLELEADVGALLHGTRQAVNATVAVNGSPIAEWRFSSNEPAGKRRASVPAALVRDTGAMIVEFTVADPASPASLGMAVDNRLLALSFRSLVVRTLGGT